MNFFGLGFGEILLIVLIVLVVVGPERLPGLARQTGLLIARVQSWLQRSPDAMMIMQARKELEKEIDNLRGELVRMQQAQAQLVSSTKQSLTEIKETVEQPFAELKSVASSSVNSSGGRSPAAPQLPAKTEPTIASSTPQIELTTPDPDAPDFAMPKPTPQIELTTPDPDAPDFAMPKPMSPIELTTPDPDAPSFVVPELPAPALVAPPTVAAVTAPTDGTRAKDQALTATPASATQIDELVRRLDDIGAVVVALQDELRRQGLLGAEWQPRTHNHAANGAASLADEPLDVL